MELIELGVIASSATGWLYFLTHGDRPIRAVWDHFFRQSLEFSERYGKGSWVVVTGGSDGIGFGFAEAFAARGFNIVILARRPAGLAKAESQLKNKFPSIQVRTIQADFQQWINDHAWFDKIVEQMQDIDISVLVNNVGTGIYAPYFNQTNQAIDTMLALNVHAITFLTHRILPRLLKRGKGAIINLSSCAGLVPNPIGQIYSATKAYDHYFSLALSEEVKGHGIDVLSVTPRHVVTPLYNSIAEGKRMWSTATVDQCVEGALKELGRGRWSHGYWKHAFHTWLRSWSTTEKRIRDSYKASAAFVEGKL